MSLHIQPPKAPSPLRPWLETVKEKKHRMLVQEPHHYTVSLLLTGLLIVLGHHGPTEHCLVWFYAVFENVSKAREAHGTE